MSAEDRDRWFAKALARHLRDASGDRDAACLDAETLAAYHEGSLPADEALRVRNHLESCSRCLQVVQQLLATQDISESPIPGDKLAVAGSPGKIAGPAEPPPTTGAPAKHTRANMARFPDRKTPLRWAAPVGAIAAAVLLFFGLRTFRVPLAKHSEPGGEIAERRQDNSALRDSYVVQPAPRSSPAVAQDEHSRALQQQSAKPAPGTSAEGENLQDEADWLKDVYEEKQLPPAPRSASPAPARNAPSAGIGGRISSSNDEKAQAKSQDLDAVRMAGKARSAPNLAEPGPDRSAQSQTNAASGARAYSPPAAPPPAAAPLQQNQTVVVEPAAPEIVGQSAGLAARKKKESDLPMAKRDAISALAPSGMTARSGNSVWNFGEHGAIMHSSDGGKTWKRQVAAVDAALTSGSAPSKSVCWIAGTAGTLLRTTDGGKQWRLVITPVAGDLGGVLAGDSKHATIWDSTRRLSYATSDGGKTWAKKP